MKKKITALCMLIILYSGSFELFAQISDEVSIDSRLTDGALILKLTMNNDVSTFTYRIDMMANEDKGWTYYTSDWNAFYIKAGKPFPIVDESRLKNKNLMEAIDSFVSNKSEVTAYEIWVLSNDENKSLKSESPKIDGAKGAFK